MIDGLTLVIPGTPPSGNHYKKPRGRGLRGSYVTDEAKAFFSAVAALSMGRRVMAKSYAVRIEIFLGARQKGDLDNFAKVALDALVRASVIDTDDRVMRIEMSKGRDRDCPRTCITVQAMEAER